MNKVKKRDYSNPPQILEKKECYVKREQAIEEKQKHDFSGYYYRHKTVMKSLFSLYHHKCAYCETKPLPGSTLRVDHYRPKINIKGETSHPGYYWLGYEWSNFLPTCDSCNNAKSNAFPIEPAGKRVAPSKPYEYTLDAACFLAEKPLILHPELDDPKKHLIFLPNGKVKGITNRGEKTIEVCKLNRNPLVLERRKSLDSFLREIRNLLRDLKDKKCNNLIFRYTMKLIF